MTGENEMPAPGAIGDGRDAGAFIGGEAQQIHSTTAASLEMCLATLTEHLATIAGAYAGRDGLIELAADTPPRKPGDRASLNRAHLFSVDDIDAMAAWAARVSQHGGNVYLGPALRRADAQRDKRTTDVDAIASRFAWADFDEEGAFDAALNDFDDIGAEPNWITITGESPYRRGQCFWALTDDTPLADLRDLQKFIAERFDGDSSVINAGRVMRLAGTLAHPRKPGRMPELTSALHSRTRAAPYRFADLRDRLAPSPHGETWAAAALASAVERVRGAAEGARHKTLFKEAAAIGELVAGGHLSAGEAQAALAEAAHETGLPDDEISDALAAAFKRTGDKPRGPTHGHAYRPADDIAKEPEALIPAVRPGKPWPLDALGDVLADAANVICAAVQCPEGLAGPSVLTAATLAVQGHFDMQHPLGHAAPCSLTLVTLGDSGERKSTADKMALQAFYDAATEREALYRKEYVQYRALMEARDAKKSHIKGQRKDDTRTAEDIARALAALGPDPFPPIPPKRIVTDPNFEGMIKWMAEAHGSVAWISNEAGGSVGGTAFADENRLKFGAGLSLLWDGQPIERVRAGDGHHTLLGRRFTCHLMLQGEIARPFLSDPILRAQGWLSRALICEPTSKIGFRPWREPGDVKAALAPYYARLRMLIDKGCPIADKDGPRNVLKPVPIPWDAEARTIWIAFHDEVEAALRLGGEMADHRGFGAKIAENAARIATVLAAFGGAKTVAASHMSQGIVIAGHYVDETLRHREAAATSSEMILAEKVRAWLMRWPSPTASIRDIQNRGPNQARDQKTAKRCAAILRQFGWLVGAENGPWEIKGRP